jgi:hypothetical protein
MWEFFQGYGIWILLAIFAFFLVAGGCGRGRGTGCGGHGSHRHRDQHEPWYWPVHSGSPGS